MTTDRLNSLFLVRHIDFYADLRAQRPEFFTDAALAEVRQSEGPLSSHYRALHSNPNNSIILEEVTKLRNSLPPRYR
jgi:hypothetical protein